MKVSRGARVLALLLATAFGWSLWTACTAAAFSPENAQMACCKDGQFTCGSNSSPSDCCKTDAARHHDVVSTAKIEHHQPLAVVMAWAVAANPTLFVAQSCLHATSSPRLEFGPPPYIAYSSLLI